MGLVCALIVVMIHFPYNGNVGSLHFFYDVFPGALKTMAVPFFFCASGFLLVGKCDNSGWWKEAVKKRCLTLLVPYLALNIVFGIWRCVRYAFLAPMLGTPVVLPTWKTPLECLGILPMGGGPALFVLWYVRTLFFFVLISPIVVRLVKWSQAASIVLVTLLLLFSIRWVALTGYFGQYFFPAAALGYFIGGILLRFGVFRRFNPYIKSKYMGLALGGGLAIKLFCQETSFLSQLGNVMVILGIWSLLPSKPWPGWLTSCAFPIYVFHPIVIEFYWIVMRHLGFMNCVTDTLCGNLLSLAFVIVSAAASAHVIRTCLPRIHMIFLGGR